MLLLRCALCALHVTVVLNCYLDADFPNVYLRLCFGFCLFAFGFVYGLVRFCLYTVSLFVGLVGWLLLGFVFVFCLCLDFVCFVWLIGVALFIFDFNAV